MIFHAKIKKEGQGYQIQFLELPNVVTYCKNKDDIREMARDALIGCIEEDLDRFLDIPVPKNINSRNIISIALPLSLNCSILFRKLRKQRGWTTAEVAKKLGISRQAYEKLESSKANHSAQTIERVLNVLGKACVDIEIEELAA